jgi:hypothetical protein
LKENNATATIRIIPENPKRALIHTGRFLAISLTAISSTCVENSYYPASALIGVFSSFSSLFSSYFSSFFSSSSVITVFSLFISIVIVAVSV